MTLLKRDSKGRFVKGSGAPKTAFSKTNQPKNPGRKPSRFKQIISELNELDDPLSLEDFRKIALSLLSVDKDKLVAIAKKKTTPIAVVIIASAIAGDIENKQMANLDRLMDRIFGKALQPTDITSNGESIKEPSGLTKDQIDKLIEKL